MNCCLIRIRAVIQGEHQHLPNPFPIENVHFRVVLNVICKMDIFFLSGGPNYMPFNHDALVSLAIKLVTESKYTSN